jgi:ketosteroid isomerase-like protein
MKPVSRRRAAMLALAAPLSVNAAGGSAAAASPLDDLIQRTEQQAAAFMAGDMTRWIGLAQPTADFTLMQPFGGGASHGFDSSPERLSALSRAFRNGDAKLEMAQSYVSDDLIVLVMIERQHGEVHGLPGQDWSLRVTQVYRRDGSEWCLAHRHADPLVRPIGLEKAASLARGQ